MPADPADVRPRTPWGTLSREQIVTAAISAIRAGDFDHMTIRSLATDLGVAPMALYRHVRDKDDLLDEVADVLLSEAWRPPPTQSDWKKWIAAAADQLRGLLVEQPVVLHVYLRHPVVTPAAMERMEAMLGVLENAGFDKPAARRAYGSIHTYTVGFAALEASRDRWSNDAPGGDAMYRQLAEFTTPRQFSMGLGFLLAGIEQQA